jgi:hypothetical protein
MKMRTRRRKAIHLLICIFGISSLGILVRLDWPGTALPVLLGSALVIPCFAMARFSFDSRRDHRIALAGLVVAAVTIFIMPPTLAIVSAYVHASLVRGGYAILPWTILGMPLLDVSAEEVQVIWICPDAQRPSLFKQSPGNEIGLLVGETSTSYYIRWGGPSQPSKIVKLPQNCALLTHYA